MAYPDGDFLQELGDQPVHRARQTTASANPCFSPGNREIFKKNREAIEHEPAITERD
jgi:hypothetical protein